MIAVVLRSNKANVWNDCASLLEYGLGIDKDKFRIGRVMRFSISDFRFSIDATGLRSSHARRRALPIGFF